MKVKNVSTGPRGLNTKTGPVVLDKDEERDGIELTEAEAKIAKATGWFDIADSEPEGDKDEIEALRAEAASLKIDVDKRWGTPRLREEIAKSVAAKA